MRRKKEREATRVEGLEGFVLSNSWLGSGWEGRLCCIGSNWRGLHLKRGKGKMSEKGGEVNLGVGVV